MKTTTDYTKLPDGIVLISRHERRWVKGPHPVAKHVQGVNDRSCAWLQGSDSETYPNWITFPASGRSCYENSSKYDIVGYEIPTGFDWSTLPEGTTLICANGRKFTKVDKLPPAFKNNPVKGKCNGGYQTWNKYGTADSGSTDWCLVDFELPEPKPLTTENLMQAAVDLANATCGIPGHLTDANIYLTNPATDSSTMAFTLKDIPMNQAQTAYAGALTVDNGPVFVETRTFINGVDIYSMRKSDIYQLIADQEAEIKRLEAIENKPKMLQAEIDERRAGIEKLVAHLDSAA